MNKPNLAFDTSDVDKWIGKQIVFAEFFTPFEADCRSPRPPAGASPAGQNDPRCR